MDPDTSSGDTPPDLETLLSLAARAAGRAYAPASNFPVGAVLVADDGRVFTGCNVENASYGLTMCAERNAVFHAVAEGARRFTRCVVHTPKGAKGYPCGACCQVLAEFGPEMEIVLAGGEDAPLVRKLRDFLPLPFRFES